MRLDVPTRAGNTNANMNLFKAFFIGLALASFAGANRAGTNVRNKLHGIIQSHFAAASYRRQ
jgi:hypothetical protein